MVKTRRSLFRKREDYYLFISINGERFGKWDKGIPLSIEDFVHGLAINAEGPEEMYCRATNCN